MFFLTVHKFLNFINTRPDDFIHGQWEKLETSDEQNNALRSMDYPATHPVILLYNKLLCINHFQPLSRPSSNFKQKFHQIHSVHNVFQLVRHGLINHQYFEAKIMESSI